MATFPEPVFFDTDENKIIAEMTTYYEGLVGKKLAPSQTETLLINAFAFREKMLRIAGNEAAKQNLLDFAVYPVLDYLGALLDVERLPASSAECTIKFILTPGHPSLLIPQGLRLQSKDGKVIFITLDNITVSSGINTANVTASCTTEGALGNGYQPGDISIILDPQAFVSSAANINITSGGSDQESDVALRERIRLAPAAFSTAGPDDAYIFFAKSASPLIIDVGITSPEGAYVNIYPLLAGGVVPPTEIIDAVQAKCSPEKVRPLNDIVNVLAPDAINYTLNIQLTLETDAVYESVLTKVNANIAAYVNARQTKLGVDVVPAQIIERAKVDGVYDVVVVSPSAKLIIARNQFANCTGINITVTGESEI
jgi:phage-related baseplate assembly protein